MRCIILSVITLLSASTCPAEVLDQIIFGDSTSELSHSVLSVTATAETGALAQSCRHISGDGSITFTLACDPVRQNYLTVKLWGGDTVSETQYLYLYDPINRIGNYQDDWPEVVIWTSQAPFPGRFVYSTYLIPTNLTGSKTQVTLKLADAELPIYRVYSHLEPLFDVFGEVQGTNPGPGPVRPTGSRSQYDQLVYQANLGIAEFLTWQKYGPAWDAAVAAGQAPAMITGAVTFDGRGGNASWTVQQWKEDIYTRFTNSNSVCLQVLEAYGIAYNSPWSSYYHNAQLVDRIVKGLDFFRIAQGANGAFGNPWGLVWIGGPNRVNGAQCLEGFGVHALANAFLQVHNQIIAGVLNELVDEDDNPATPDVTRKTSYINLFKGIIEHMIADRGHAPNQDRAQVHAMYQANECLKILSPDNAWTDSQALQWVYEAMGAAPNPIYDGYWESEKGLSLEVHGTINGGYCGNYGAAAINFAHIYGNMTGKTNTIVNGIIQNEVNSFANYLYIDNDSDGYNGLVNESVISWRPNTYPAKQFPNTGCFNGLAYAALELNNQNAVRILQHYMNNRSIYQIDCSASAVAAHYEDNTMGAVKMVDIFQQVQALLPTSARLPMETDTTMAWADEQAAGVVLQHQEARLYITMNWRHDYCSGCDRSEANAVVNNIARIHYTTNTIDRIANVGMESPYGKFKLYTCRYGDYLIALNVSETESFALDVSELEGDYAADIISNTKIDIRTNPVVQPRTTMILYPGRCYEFLNADVNKDCYVNFADFEVFASEWLKNLSL